MFLYRSIAFTFAGLLAVCVLFNVRSVGAIETTPTPLDLSHCKAVTEPKTFATFPAWSPDGKHIAFVFRGNETSQIGVVDVNGSNQRSITDDNDIHASPTWSSDSKQLAFVATHRDVTEAGFFYQDQIQTIMVDSAKLLRTFSIGSYFSQTANQVIFVGWSPDSTQIAFSSSRYQNGRIQLIALDAPDPVTSSSITNLSGLFSWSPDSKYLALASGASLRIASVDGLDQRDLLGSWPSFVTGIPTWSPDGKQIAFTSSQPKDGLYIVNIDNKQVRFLASGGHSAAWSPGGQYIAYTSNYQGHTEVYIAKVADSSVYRLTYGDDNVANLSWSPDGKEIAFIGLNRVNLTNIDAPCRLISPP